MNIRMLACLCKGLLHFRKGVIYRQLMIEDENLRARETTQCLGAKHRLPGEEGAWGWEGDCGL